MKKNKICILLVLCAGCIFSSCKEQMQNREPVSYKTMTVSMSETELYRSYSASIEGNQYVEIRPQISGLITRICIDEGARISKGTPLFIIDQVPYEAALKTASAAVKSAQAKVSTARLTATGKQELYKENVISDFELQTALNSLGEAEALLAQAEADEMNARNNLSYTIIKSPVDGVAGMIPYKVGALVNSSISEPLVTVSSVNEMFAYFSVSENQLQELVGEPDEDTGFIENLPLVELKLGNGKLYAEKGKVTAVSGITDAQTGAVGIRASFPNPQRLLRSGSTATVVVPYKINGCIVIPKAATYEIQNKVFVYKVVDGIATSAEIKPFKLNNGSEYAVMSGLTEGDVIVAEGAGLLREGTPISGGTASAHHK